MAETSGTASGAHREFMGQVAGHDAIRLLDDGNLAKPAVEREIRFYEDAQKDSEIRGFLPEFYGCTSLVVTADEEDCSSTSTRDSSVLPTDKRMIVLENLIEKFRKPCIIDIKLGTRLYDDDASQEKKARMIKQANVTTSGATGIRICGAKFWDPSLLDYAVYNREFGRSLTPNNLYDAFRQIFSKSGIFTDIVRGLSQRLTQLKEKLMTRSVRLYSSSILIVFEGDPILHTHREIELTQHSNKLFDVRMIDFAHSHWQDGIGPDEGYLFGLGNVIDMLNRMLEDGATK